MANSLLINAEDDNLELDKDLDLNDDGDTGEDVELEDLMAQIGGDDDDDDDDQADAKAQPKAQPADYDEIVNQRVVEELNRIIPQRLARDRKTQEVQELEQITGMSLADIRAQIIENAVTQTADDMGISDEEARKIVNQRFENQSLKAEKTNQQQDEANANAAMAQVQYLQDRMDAAKQTKLSRFLTKEVLAEVDRFTQKGAILPFKDGLKFVLGSKLAEGELIGNIQAGATKKAQANMARNRVAPQSKASGAANNDGNLTREQREIAMRLGLTSKEDLKEFAREVRSENKRKQSRSR